MLIGRRFEAAIYAIAIAVVFSFLSGPLVDSAQAADKEKPREIMLTLRVGVTGQTLVKVQPRDAKIWRNSPGKPNRIRWWTVNNTPYKEVFWEIRHDTSRGGSEVDYFGDIDIECGQSEVTIEPSVMPDAPNARWPYTVTVYGCVNGERAQMFATLNPLILWKD